MALFSSRRIIPQPSSPIRIPEMLKYPSYPTSPTSPSSSSQENSPKNPTSPKKSNSTQFLENIKRCTYCSNVFQPQYTECGAFCSLDCKCMSEKYSRKPKQKTLQPIQFETKHIPPPVDEHTSGMGRSLLRTKS